MTPVGAMQLAVALPAAAQTKAVNKLGAKHRLALTGTPVENRLGSYVSIALDASNLPRVKSYQARHRGDVSWAYHSSRSCSAWPSLLTHAKARSTNLAVRSAC